jgi:UDP:flavonoid glycosyltransferase YjiC (YdhE family)
MLGALTHGLPQLLLPQGGDQFVNSQACQHAGVALVLSAQQVSRRASEALRADCWTRHRSRWLKKRYRRRSP